jgi:hypothetical protein
MWRTSEDAAALLRAEAALLRAIALAPQARDAKGRVTVCVDTAFASRPAGSAAKRVRGGGVVRLRVPLATLWSDFHAALYKLALLQHPDATLSRISTQLLRSVRLGSSAAQSAQGTAADAVWKEEKRPRVLCFRLRPDTEWLHRDDDAPMLMPPVPVQSDVSTDAAVLDTQTGVVNYPLLRPGTLPLSAHAAAAMRQPPAKRTRSQRRRM